MYLYVICGIFQDFWYRSSFLVFPRRRRDVARHAAATAAHAETEAAEAAGSWGVAWCHIKMVV